MTLSTVITKREREWLRTAEGAIRRGDEAQLLEALDEAGKDLHIGARPTSQLIGIIIHAKHNKPPNKKRETLMRVVLAHPAVSMPDPGHHPGMITTAIEKKQFGLLPLLHETGFSLLGNQRERDLLIKQLSEGRWPHPDLLMPNILAELENPWPLVGGLYSEACMKPDFMKKLVAMDGPSIPLSKVASRGLVRAEKEIQAMHDKTPKAVATCLALLAGKGWLDMNWIQIEIDQQDGAGKPLLGLIAQAQAHQLSQATPQPTSRTQRRF